MSKSQPSEMEMRNLLVSALLLVYDDLMSVWVIIEWKFHHQLALNPQQKKDKRKRDERIKEHQPLQ